MSKNQPQRRPADWEADLAQRPAREYVTYILAGVITLGLIGWLVGLAVHQSWLPLVGIGLGAVAGAYLAWRHQVDRHRAFGDSSTGGESGGRARPGRGNSSDRHSASDHHKETP